MSYVDHLDSGKRVDGLPCVLVTDIHNDLVDPAAGLCCSHPLSDVHDWLSLIPLCELVRVERYNYPAVVPALPQELCVSVVEHVESPTNVHPGHHSVISSGSTVVAIPSTTVAPPSIDASVMARSLSAPFSWRLSRISWALRPSDRLGTSSPLSTAEKV